MEQKQQKFFLGAKSCNGFVSHFSDSFSAKDGWRAYLIKGGPGTGKSSLMKYLALRGEEYGEEPILCPCSSDPLSLDGVIFEKRKAVILDATAPHVVEPQLPGVCEQIINLGEFWNADKLRKNSRAVIAAAEKNKGLHKNASAFLRAAGQVMESSLALTRPAADTDRIISAALRCAKRLLPETGKQGSEKIRFLQGITPLGIVTYTDTVRNYYPAQVIVSDPYGCVGNVFMQTVREYALAAGYSIITVKSAFLPDKITDHILIPDIGLAFITESPYFRFGGEQRRIHARRFTDAKKLREVKQRLLFRRRVTKELLSAACETLALAKASHDELEKYYISAMDFDRIPPFAASLAEKIFSEE